MAGHPVKRIGYSILQQHREEVLEKIARGGSQRAVSDWLEVSEAVVSRWLRLPQNMADYKEALKLKAEVMAHQALEIVDEEPGRNPITGMIDSGHVAWAKLRADNRRWHAAKMDPATYGDKQQVEMSGTVQVVPAFVQAIKGDRLGNTYDGESTLLSGGDEEKTD